MKLSFVDDDGGRGGGGGGGGGLISASSGWIVFGPWMNAFSVVAFTQNP